MKADNEWCAEAYMQTDYSQISDSDFENTVLNYVTFLFNNKVEVENEWIEQRYWNKILFSKNG